MVGVWVVYGWCMGGGGVGLGGLMDNYFVGFYFIESALQDVFVYKAGAFNYFFLTKKSSLLKSVLLLNFLIR